MAVKILTIPAFLAQNPQPVTGPVTLSGRRYILRLHWSPLAGWGTGAWLLDVSDASGVVIAASLAVVDTGDDGDLLVGYHDDTRAPPGRLVVARLSGEATDPTAHELGTAIEIRYVT